jgi:hypothetical protein
MAHAIPMARKNLIIFICFLLIAGKGTGKSRGFLSRGSDSTAGFLQKPKIATLRQFIYDTETGTRIVPPR